MSNARTARRRKLTWFESNLSVVRYNDVMKDWLGRFKYRGDEGLQLLFARNVRVVVPSIS